MVHLTEKWKLRIRGFLALGLFLLFVWTVFRQNESVSAVIQTCLLVAVLFVSYRFGPGNGAISGAIAGVILSIWTKEIAQLGIFCMLGVVCGAFRPLGRLASVCAYLAAALGLGIMYSPEGFLASMEIVLIGGAAFLLLPGNLVERPEIIGKKQKEWEFPWALDSRLPKRELQMADAMRALQELYEKNSLNLEYLEEEPAQIWRKRCLEVRALFEEMTAEFADVFGMLGHGSGKQQEIPEETCEYLCDRLEEYGIRVLQTALYRDACGRMELFLTLETRTERCVTMKLVTEAVSRAVGKRMKAVSDGEFVITKKPKNIYLEEDTDYRLLFGTASGRKAAQEYSGDCFSCVKIPGGKTMLFLCDGMGSGIEAREASRRITEAAEQLAKAGVEPRSILHLLNGAVCMQMEQKPMTFDMAVIDRYSGSCDLVKQGASVSVVCGKQKAELYASDSLPLGAVSNPAAAEYVIRLSQGESLIMVTDGILDALPVIEKEEAFQEFCKKQYCTNPREMAERVLRFASSYGALRDDMSVLVAALYET